MSEKRKRMMILRLFCFESKYEYDPFQLLKIKGVFRLFDKDEDGDIPAQELGTALRALGAYPSVGISNYMI